MRDKNGFWFDRDGLEVGYDGYWTIRDIEPEYPVTLVSELKKEIDKCKSLVEGKE
jgi:hypothetical protein